jgi:hypothetical protein
MKYLTILFLILSTQSYADWYLSKNGVWGSGQTGKRVEAIPDSEVNFNLEKLKCSVSKTELSRFNLELIEKRTLRCQITPEVSVRVIVVCSAPYKTYEMNQITIDDNDVHYYPTLICTDPNTVRGL